MKAYIGQIICNDKGKIMGKVVRIVHSETGNIAYFVPVFTEVGFGDLKYYRSESGDLLE